MKFGKQLNLQIEETLPEWRNKFLSYKALKKLVHRISSAQRSGNAAEAQFIRLLDAEIHKLNSFFVEQEEDFIITQKELRERIRTVMETHGPAARRPSETEYAADMSSIRKDIVNFHGEMVLLENYSSINYTAHRRKRRQWRNDGLPQTTPSASLFRVEGFSHHASCSEQTPGPRSHLPSAVRRPPLNSAAGSPLKQSLAASIALIVACVFVRRWQAVRAEPQCRFLIRY